MRAVILDYERRCVAARSLPQPRRTRDDEALFRVLEVGVCGTDRELAEFRLGYPPEGESFLVPGHEAVGQVVEVGPAVTGLQPGDWVTPMVRRSCTPACASCARLRRDICLTGGARERGIFGIHGYFCEYAVDREEDLVRVPPGILDVAVLLEPLSVVEKAVSTALRCREAEAATALVLGAGTIGILAALTLQGRGLEVTVKSLEPLEDPKARLIQRAGIRYLNGPLDRKADIVIEAAGSGEAAFEGIRSLGPLGVCMILGGRNHTGEVPFLDMILYNQMVIGSVNASPEAFHLAIADLGRFDRPVLNGMIHRLGFSAAQETLLRPPAGIPKLVHRLAE